MQLNNSSLFKQSALVNGTWTGSSDNNVIEVHNPFDSSAVGSVPNLGASDIQRAIASAQKALPAWRAMTAKERAPILRKLYALILENREDLAAILTTEQGKPLTEARAEISTGAEYFLWYAEEARRKYGQVIPATAHGNQPVTFSQGIGVAALITPWNFPMSMLARKASAALAAGCSIVAKPASNTPFSALALAALALEAGVPEGVFNMVTGKASVIGSELCASPAVKALSFTGSTEVGKQLMADCAGTVKKVSLELGGNAPLLVFADADIGQAVQGAVASKFRNSGQTCICANRILVEKSIHDLFVEKFEKAVRALVPGNGLDTGTTQGPLITADAVNTVSSMVEDALSRGATLVCGGKQLADLGPNFYQPTVLTGVTSQMRVFREEIFGPVAPVIPFASEEEAIALANDSRHGLASYLFARDIGKIWRVSRALESGMVGVNESGLSSCEVPFGGVKESGAGREGGTFGLDEYMETKYVLFGDLE